jgi:hypothetical protein
MLEAARGLVGKETTMGCDIANHGERVPYCKPECKEFKLVKWLDDVKAKCIRCSLLHEFTVTLDSKIKIKKR